MTVLEHKNPVRASDSRIGPRGIDGVDISRKVYDTGYVDLATDAAATTLASGVIPAGARVLGATFAVGTAIAGIDSTTGTLTVDDEDATEVTFSTISAFTAGTSQSNLTNEQSGDIILDKVADIVFTLSGGADNTPSAGTVRAIVWYESIDGL